MFRGCEVVTIVLSGRSGGIAIGSVGIAIFAEVTGGQLKKSRG